jgi:hypothetical protein
MKLLPLAILLPITFIAPVEAQQLNTYQVCHTYQEQYSPGYYTNNGSYIQGGVYTIKNTVNCETGEVYSSQPYSGGRNVVVNQQPYYRQRRCNPYAGAALGAGLAEAISGGNGWRSSSNWTRNYNRNSSSGSYNYSNRNYKSNGWSLLGGGLGALIFGC